MPAIAIGYTAREEPTPLGGYRAFMYIDDSDFRDQILKRIPILAGLRNPIRFMTHKTKNFRVSPVRIAGIIGIAMLFSCTSTRSTEASEPTWKQLFNGKDLNDWIVKINGYPIGNNFGNTFRITDGKLAVNYDQYDQFNDRFGHIFYKNQYSAYLLGVEYRFIGDQIKGGPDWAIRNSGAMIHSQSPETMGLNQDFPISLEVQMLGGNGTDERTTANLCTPGTNVVMNGKLITDHCINSTSKTYAGDQWVRVEVLVLRDSIIKHIVQGDTVLTYEKPQIGGGSVSNYNPVAKRDLTILTEGYISLQSESHPIEFRKVEIFDLSSYVWNKRHLNAILTKLRSRKASPSGESK